MRLRISGGVDRGVRIDSAHDSRPTQERVRLALFSVWAERIEGARFLDLFCGGGAVGLEALSRGAMSCTFVDSRQQALSVVRGNRARLSAAGGVTTLRSLAGPGGFRPALDRVGECDLVFADPPYDFTWWKALLEAVAPLVDGGSSIAIEHSSRVALPATVAGLAAREVRAYGDSALSWYQPGSSSDGR